MPCKYDDCETSGAAENRVRAELEPLLCEACTVLENAGLLGKTSSDLRKWYQIHDKREEHRARLEAAEKLSEKDRRLLGIDVASLQRAYAQAKCQ